MIEQLNDLDSSSKEGKETYSRIREDLAKLLLRIYDPHSDKFHREYTLVDSDSKNMKSLMKQLRSKVDEDVASLVENDSDNDEVHEKEEEQTKNPTKKARLSSSSTVAAPQKAKNKTRRSL